MKKIFQIFPRVNQISRVKKRFYSQQPRKENLPSSPSPINNNNNNSKNRQIITEETAKAWREMTPKERVIYATKQTSYTGISIAGLGLSATLIYYVFSELFSTDHATAIYNRSLDKIRGNDKVVEMMGEPIKGYLEHNRFSRKRFDIFEDEESGEKTGFMKFGVSGPIQTGVISAWLRYKDGEWKYDHLNCRIGRKVIVIEENRNKQ